YCYRDRLLDLISPTSYSAMLSVLLLSAATSKISLLPLSLVIVCFAIRPLLLKARIGSISLLLALAVPWVIFFCPIAAWTWMKSGSPFGPVLAGTFAPSIYLQSVPQQIFQSTTETNQIPLLTLAQYVAIDYSPLVWLGVVGAIVATHLPARTRLALAAF